MNNWFRRKRTAAVPAVRPPAKAPLILALEPRVMYDAALVATAAEATHAVKADAAQPQDHASAEAHTGMTALAGALPAAAPADNGHAVLFVDARVQDAAGLLQGVAPGTEVVMLQRGADGLQQMADFLAQHPGASSVQVVAHGDAGNLWLGDTFLSEATLAQHAQQLATIGQGIAQGGDLLLYACNTAQGEAGVRFVDSLAALTGRDVAASSNRTGAGSDWTLEVTTGSIEARPVLAASSEAAYQHDLATLTVTSGADSGAGSLRNAIASATSGDTITFSSGMSVVLSSGQLSIAKNLTIEGDLDGNGTPDVTIDANYTSRVFNITAGTVKLDGLTIQHGLVSGTGGNAGNAGIGATQPGQAGGDALGAGIFVGAATVTLTHDVITGNRAAGGGGGGAGYNGTGYQRFHPDTPTPYLWSWTTLYTRGKYVADGRWDPWAVSQQCGAAAILRQLREAK